MPKCRPGGSSYKPFPGSSWQRRRPSAAGPLATAELGGIGTFRRAAENLFPTLADSGTVSASLAEGEGFYRWPDPSYLRDDFLGE